MHKDTFSKSKGPWDLKREFFLMMQETTTVKVWVWKYTPLVLAFRRMKSLRPACVTILSETPAK